MTCLALVPLLAGIFAMVGITVLVLQKKSLAQSICIQRTSLLTEELGKRLSELLRLNRRARALRRSHELAEKALRIAKATNFLPGIVGAEAWLRGTEVAQVLLGIRQRAILAEAELARLRHRRLLRADLRALHVTNVRLDSIERRALAVRASPPRALAPEYFPVSGFARRQAQSVGFDVQLAPPLAGHRAVRQHTGCAITLQRKERLWHPQIIAASARSNWLSWP